MTDGSADFVLAWPGETQSGDAVYLTQRDVREVQLAKAAIFAGIEIMKRDLGVTNDDLKAVYLAGASAITSGPSARSASAFCPR